MSSTLEHPSRPALRRRMEIPEFRVQRIERPGNPFPSRTDLCIHPALAPWSRDANIRHHIQSQRELGTSRNLQKIFQPELAVHTESDVFRVLRGSMPQSKFHRGITSYKLNHRTADPVTESETRVMNSLPHLGQTDVTLALTCFSQHSRPRNLPCPRFKSLRGIGNCFPHSSHSSVT